MMKTPHRLLSICTLLVFAALMGCSDDVTSTNGTCAPGEEVNPISGECDAPICPEGQEYNSIGGSCEPTTGNDGNSGTGENGDNNNSETNNDSGNNGSVWNSSTNNDNNNNNNNGGGDNGESYEPYDPQDPESAQYHSCESDDFDGFSAPQFILDNPENYLLAIDPDAEISNLDAANTSLNAHVFEDGQKNYAGFIVSLSPPTGEDNSGDVSDWFFNRIDSINGYSAAREGTGNSYVTHDNFPASVLNHVAIDTSDAPGAVRDHVVGSIFGIASGDLDHSLGELAEADGSGAHLVYKTVFRDANQVLIVGGITTSDLQNEPESDARFALQDLAGGTALALAGETMSDQCVSMEIHDTTEVDIIISMDASGSMSDVNNGIINFADELVDILDNADVDWRVGVTGVDCDEIREDEDLSQEFRNLWPDPDEWEEDDIPIPFPNAENLLPDDLNTPCRNPDGIGSIGAGDNNGRLMQGSFTTDASEIADRLGQVSTTGLEYTMTMGIAAIDHSLPRADNAADKIRTNAAVVVIAVTDENEQLFKDAFSSWISGGNDPISSNQRSEMEGFIQPWLNYLHRPDINATVSGLYWVPGTNCVGGEDVGHGMHHIVQQTGGTYDSICNPDIGTAFGNIADATQELLTGLHLIGRPYSGSVDVDVTDLDTDEVTPLVRSVVDGFDFDTTNNSLFFEGPSTPDIGERVVVPYLQWDQSILSCSTDASCAGDSICVKGACQ